MREVGAFQGAGGFGGGFGGGGGGFDLNDLLRDRAGGGAAAASATCSATSSAGRRRRARSQQRRPQKGADVETTATIGFTDALDGVTISLRLTSDAPCPDCSGTGGKPGTKPARLPRVRGRRLRDRLGRRRVLDERDLPGLRRPPARVRRAVPDLPRQRARHVGAHDPGPDPGRRQGRPADPAARQGRGRRERRPGRRPVRHRQGLPAPAVRPQGRQPDPRRPRLLRRARARRGDQDPDPRRRAGHPQGAAPGTPNGRTFRIRGRGAPARPTAPAATCWPPSRCRCPAVLDEAARDAVAGLPRRHQARSRCGPSSSRTPRPWPCASASCRPGPTPRSS